VRLLFPEIHDLRASKLTVAVTGGFGRRSDRAFIVALVEAGHIDLELLHERVDQLPDAVPDDVRQAAHDIIMDCADTPTNRRGSTLGPVPRGTGRESTAHSVTGCRHALFVRDQADQGRAP